MYKYKYIYKPAVKWQKTHAITTKQSRSNPSDILSHKGGWGVRGVGKQTFAKFNNY